jgi:CRISPR-associated protein Cmr3
MPATVVEVVGEEGELARLDPLKEALPGWRPPEPGMLPLWRRDRRPGKRAEGFLTLDGLRVFLEGGVPKMGQVLRPDELYGFDYRTGIEFDGGARTAKKGGIYGVRLLVLKESVSLYAELMGPPEVLSSLSTGKDVLLPLGGEGRRVAVRRTVPVEWPSVRPATPGEGLLLLLTTPGLFGGWRPLGLGLIAAAVPGSDAVSGWDLARGAPKPNRFAVPAGSVYFVKEPPAGAGGSLCASEDAALGWGGFVEGRWKHV